MSEATETAATPPASPAVRLLRPVLAILIALGGLFWAADVYRRSVGRAIDPLGRLARIATHEHAAGRAPEAASTIKTDSGFSLLFYLSGVTVRADYLDATAGVAVDLEARRDRNVQRK